MRYSSLWSKRQRNWTDSPEMGDKALLRYAMAQEGEAASPVHRNLSKSSELWRQYEKYAAQSLKNVIPITKNFGTTNWWERVIFPLISIHHTLHVQVYYCLALVRKNQKNKTKEASFTTRWWFCLLFRSGDTSRPWHPELPRRVSVFLSMAVSDGQNQPGVIWMEVGTLALF